MRKKVKEEIFKIEKKFFKIFRAIYTPGSGSSKLKCVSMRIRNPVFTRQTKSNYSQPWRILVTWLKGREVALLVGMW
jgi:hypothetical protein